MSVQSPKTADALSQRFSTDPDTAWQEFCRLHDWEAREETARTLRSLARGEGCRDEGCRDEGCRDDAWMAYCRLYRDKLDGVICDDFYDLDAVELAHRYNTVGSIEVPFLTDDGAAALALRAEELEEYGKYRYREPRPSYPPGDAFAYDDDDPRKALWTEVNMTAIGIKHMESEDLAMWVYHSPHLNCFLSAIVGCRELYPYSTDLGLALNISRPLEGAKMATGWHFDSIDSSRGACAAKQPRGVTGVIGLQDCVQGGERVVFPSVHREDVQLVGEILEKFDPAQPGSVIGTEAKTAMPTVFPAEISKTLYLFDGGHTLHGVCPVRKGARIAAAFMMREEPPNEQDAATEASSRFFYDTDTSNDQATKRRKSQDD